MNDRSSRAHTLFFLHLEQEVQSSGVAVVSSMCFTDLGGSEQVCFSRLFVVCSASSHFVLFLQRTI